MFAIVGKDDTILFSSPIKARQEIQHMHHFLMHSSLDKIDYVYFKNSTFYLGDLEEDKTSEFSIWCFLTSQNTKFLLLVERALEKKEDKIKAFFTSIHKLYARQLMNPLYQINDKIENLHFSQKVAGYLSDYIN